MSALMILSSDSHPILKEIIMKNNAGCILAEPFHNYVNLHLYFYSCSLDCMYIDNIKRWHCIWWVFNILSQAPYIDITILTWNVGSEGKKGSYNKPPNFNSHATPNETCIAELK